MPKYTTTFSELVSLILNLSDAEQKILLKEAQQLIGRRRQCRTSCLIPVRCNISAKSYDSFILDINEYGAFIATEEPFPVGYILTLKYLDPFNRTHQNQKGEIIWNRSEGIGVKFLNFADVS
jgi:hypothetical protein